MSSVDLDAIRARHHRVQYGDPDLYPTYLYCEECNQDMSTDPQGWPCDAIKLCDEAERLREKKFTLRKEAEWILREGERDEEITRLREALEKVAACKSQFSGNALEHARWAAEYCMEIARAALPQKAGG